MTDEQDRLWARRPHGRHAELYDAEYARQLERMARIRDEVSVSLGGSEPPPGDAARRATDAPAGGGRVPGDAAATLAPTEGRRRREVAATRWDAAPPNLATPPRSASAPHQDSPTTQTAVVEPLHPDPPATHAATVAPDLAGPPPASLADAPQHLAPPPSQDSPPAQLADAPAQLTPPPSQDSPPAQLADAPAQLTPPPSQDSPPAHLADAPGHLTPPPHDTPRTARPEVGAPRHVPSPARLVDVPAHDSPPTARAVVDPPRLAAQSDPIEPPPSRWRARWLIAGVAVLLGPLVAATLITRNGSPQPAATVFHLPGQPTGLVASGGKVWVAGPMAGAVWVLDAATGKPAGTTLRLGGTPARLALEPRFAWIADTERSAVIRAPRSGRGALRSVRTGPDLADLTVAADTVWTASSADGTVRALDGALTPQVLHVGVRPIALAGQEQRVVVLDAIGALYRLDATTRRQAGPPIDLGGAPVDVALVDDVAWVADAQAGTVRPVALGTGRAGPPIDVGRTPVAIAADAGGVFVVCRGDRTLVSLDADGSVRSRRQLAQPPTALALDSRHVWIAAGNNEVIRVDR